MDKPIEDLTLEDFKERLEMLDRSQCIEQKTALELLEMAKELLRRAAPAAGVDDQPLRAID